MRSPGQETGAWAQLRPEPPVARIGQSVTWTLTVHHPAESSVHLGNAFSREHLGWAPGDLGSVRRVPGAEAAATATGRATGAEALVPDVGPGARAPAGMGTTTLTWTGLPLEPGDLAPPGGEISWSGARGREVLEPAVLSLKVRGELAEGKDLARPPAGLESALSAEEAGTSAVQTWAAPLCLVLLGAVLFLTAVAFRRGRTAAFGGRRAGDGLTPDQALAHLRAEQRAEPGDGHQAPRRLTELSGILRRAGDLASLRHQLATESGPATGPALLGPASPPGLTDDEWLTWLAAQRLVAPEQMEAARELCTALSATRFSRRSPTRFAVERMLEQGQVLLDHLGRSAGSSTPGTGGGRSAATAAGAGGGGA